MKFLFAFVLGAMSFSAFSQSAVGPAEYVTEAQVRATKQQAEAANEAAYIAYPIGKSFWYLPGRYMRAAFYKTHKTYARSAFSHLTDKFLPTALVRFDVIDSFILETNDNGSRKYAYRVRLEDGTDAYMNESDFGAYLPGERPDGGLRDLRITRNARDADPRFVEYNDKIFAEHPETLLAKEKERTRAIADANAQEKARVEASARAAEAKAKIDRLAYEREYKRKGGVRIGMTKKQVLDSNWGRPNSVNKTITANGTSEQWVYEGSYLYFRNGTLNAIQN